jgi:hypothetical protein
MDILINVCGRCLEIDQVSAAAALLAMSMVPVANVAAEMPIADVLAFQNATPTDIETVQFRRSGFGRGFGFGAGVLDGAIIGGMLANPYYYGPAARKRGGLLHATVQVL